MPSSSKSLRRKARRKWEEDVVEHQAQRCLLCGHKHNLTLHHLIALSDGGENVRQNIVGLCRPCHLLWHGVRGGCRDSRWAPLFGVAVS